MIFTQLLGLKKRPSSHPEQVDVICQLTEISKITNCPGQAKFEGCLSEGHA